MADLAVWQRTIVDPAGNTVPNAEVEVRHSDSSALADIYLDREGAQAAPNPITADGNGFVRFYAPGGAYRVEAYGGGATAVWDFVAVGRLAEHDVIGAGQFDDDEGEHEAIRDKLDLASGAEVKVAAEAAVTAVDLASEEARLPGDFYSGPAPEVRPAIVDKHGNFLLGFDDEGQLAQNIGGDFQQGDDDFPPFAIVDRHGNFLLGFDEDGLLAQNYGAEFRGNTEPMPDFATLDKNGRVIGGYNDDGTPFNGGTADLSDLPIVENDVEPGKPWNRFGAVYIRPELGSLYTASPGLLVPGTEAVYEIYDDLMSNHSDYISSESLGQDDFGNEIIEYTAIPPGMVLDGWSEAEAAPPKIVIVNGTHGNEKESIIGGAILLDGLCNRWKEDERLQRLRWGVQIVFVPVLCPSGVDANTRVNGNGVNLNRNSDAFWSSGGSTDPESPNYKGPEPLSEPETVISKGLTTRHSDALLHIDWHTHPYPSSYGLWIGTRNDALLPIALETLAFARAYGRHQFGTVAEEDVRLSQTGDGTMARMWEQDGMPSALFEMPRSPGILGSTNNLRRYAQESILEFICRALLRRETIQAGGV